MAIIEEGGKSPFKNLSPETIRKLKSRKDKLEDKTHVVLVRDDYLAFALMSLNIPLRDDPAYVRIRHVDGTVRRQWLFHPVSLCGEHNTLKTIKLWKTGLNAVKRDIRAGREFKKMVNQNCKKWIEKHTDKIHVATFHLMQAEMSRRLVKWWFEEVDLKYLVKYVAPSDDPDKDNEITVVEGSENHQNCIDAGYIQL